MEQTRLVKHMVFWEATTRGILTYLLRAVPTVATLHFLLPTIVLGEVK